MFKKACTMGLLLWMGFLSLNAQIEVSLEFKKDFYLAHETMTAEVKIINFSGRTLTLGQDPQWLDFLIESKDQLAVEKQDKLDVVEPFELPNASRAIRRVHLVPAYKITQPGSYKVTAYLNIPQLGLRINTAPVDIGILSAVVVWEREVGVVTDDSDPTAPIDIRRFSLLRVVNEKSIDLYVKVTDRFERKIYSVYSLGNIVSFGEPERQMDRFGNLHVLMQNGARSFAYVIVKPDGETLLRQRWDYGRTRPQLGMDDEGLIQINGGFRRPTFTDIPSPDSMNEVAARQLEPVGAEAIPAEAASEASGDTKPQP